MAVRLSIEERVHIRQLHKQGLPPHQIARVMSRSWWTIQAVLTPTVATEERLWSPSSARLSMADREEIRVGIVPLVLPAPSGGTERSRSVTVGAMRRAVQKRRLLGCAPCRVARRSADGSC